MSNTESVLTHHCPFCDSRDHPHGVYVDANALELRIRYPSNCASEDLASGPLSTVYYIHPALPNQVLVPCRHLLLLRVSAVLHKVQYKSKTLVGRYSAKWDHPHFNTIDPRSAAELKLRLIAGNPRGEGIGHAPMGFRHQHTDESMNLGIGEDLDRILELRIDALYADFPSGFLDSYARFVRGFVCPCRSRRPGAAAPVAK